jgi:ankyrin repeat protein/WD40 repeat protein
MIKITQLLLFVTVVLLNFYQPIWAQQKELNNELLLAVKMNDSILVKELVKSGADINYMDENKASILMWAAYSSDINLVKFLINSGADYKKKGIIYINKNRTSYYGNLLCISAGTNKPEMLKYFLEKLKINVDDREYNPDTDKEDGWTALLWAVSQGHENIVNILLERRANINFIDSDGYNPLIISLLRNGIISELLIKKGANPNIKFPEKSNYSGYSPLLYALQNRDYYLAKLLIMNGAIVNSKANYGLTLLRFSILNEEEPEILYLLLKNGANPNETDGIGMTPAKLAASSDKCNEMLKLLYKYGADLMYEDSIYFETAIYIAEKNGQKQNIAFLNNPHLDIYFYAKWGSLVEFIKYFNGNTKSLVELDSNGQSILYHVISHNQIQIIEYFLKLGIDINLKDKNGFSMLHYACELNKIELIKLLIQKGAEVNLESSSGYTPLYYAIINKTIPEMIKLLLYKGADPYKEIKPIDKNSIVFAASSDEYRYILQLFYTFCIDFSVNKVSEKEAFDIATQYRATENVSFIENPFFKTTIDELKILIDEEKKKGNEIKQVCNIILYHAVANNRNDLVEFLLNQGGNPNYKDINGITLLHKASENSNYEIFNLLLQKGGNIYDKANDASTLMHFACRGKAGIPIIKILINKGIDINSKNAIGIIPLHIACKNENGLELVKLLIEKGTELNIKAHDGTTPLHLALKNQNGETIAKFLIEKGADINVVDSIGYSPLIYCLIHQKDELSEILIENGAHVNTEVEGNTPLCYALQKSKYKIAKLLIDKGADVNVKTPNGITSLHIALENENDFYIANILIEKGADINAITSNLKFSPIHIALQNENGLEISKKLIELGANVNVNSSIGYTPLHFAATYKNGLDLVKLMLENGAVVNVVSSEGYTPLHVALEKGNFSIARLLIEKGADVNSKTANSNLYCKEFTPLHFAVINKNNTEIVKLLIDKGAKVNVKTSGNSLFYFDYTPLQLALLQCNDIETIKLLFAKGEDVNAKTIEGITPLHIAIEEKNDIEILKILIEKGADLNAKRPDGYTPLLMAFEYSNNVLAQLLIDSGANPNIKSSGFNYKYPEFSILHFAVKNNLIDRIKILLSSKKLNINTQNYHGETPLHFAVQSKNTEVIKLLLKSGADVNIQDRYYQSPIFYCGDSLSYYKLLVEHGANINQTNFKKENVLQAYPKMPRKWDEKIELDYKILVKYLLDAGIDINHQNIDGKTLLHYAVSIVNNDFFKLLIQNGADVNIKDKNKRSPFQYLLDRQISWDLNERFFYNSEIKINWDMIDLFINNHADINARNKDGNTPLLLAGKDSIIYSLIRRGADINAMNYKFETLFTRIVSHRHIYGPNEPINPLVKFIIDNRANVNLPINDEGYTVLHDINSEEYELAKYLIEHGANVNAKVSLSSKKSANGTPLLFAIERRDLRIAKLLVEKGADVNAKFGENCENHPGFTSLLYVLTNSYMQDVDFAKYLIEKGANINVKISDNDKYSPGHSPLMLALSFNKYDFAKYLIEKGADVNTKFSESAQYKPGYTPLLIFLENGNIEMALVTIKKGANINIKVPENAKNYANWTPLHFAAAQDNLELFYLMYESNADTSVLTKSGQSIRTIASNFGSLDVLNFLNNSVKNKVFALYAAGQFNEMYKLIQKDKSLLKLKNLEGKTILHLAAQDDNLEVLTKLIKFKEGINEKDNNGETPLLRASLLGYTNLVKLLIKNGADVNLADTNGYTPLLIAQQSAYPEIEKILIDNGAIEKGINTELILPVSHTQSISSMDFSSDGKYFISGSSDKTIKLWDFSSRKEIRTFKGHFAPVKAVSFSADGKKLFSFSEDFTIRTWHIASGKEIKKNRTPIAFNNATFSKNGHFAILSNSKNEISLWDVPNSRSIVSLIGSAPVGFGSDSSFYFISEYWKKSNKIGKIDSSIVRGVFKYSISKRIITDTMDYKANYIVNIDDKEKFVFLSKDSIHFIDILSGNETTIPFKKSITSISFSPNDFYFLTSNQNSIELNEIKTGKTVYTFKGLTSIINSVSFSPLSSNISDSSSSFIFGTPNQIKIWDLKLGKPVKSFSDGCNTVKYCPDGNHFLSGNYDGTIHMVDIKSDSIKGVFKGHKNRITTISFNPDGKQYISASASAYDVRLWDIESGNEIKDFPGNKISKGRSEFNHSISFSPDKKYLLAGSSDKTIELIDFVSFSEIKNFIGHRDAINSIDFSPNGNSFASGSSDNTIKLWDINSGNVIRTFTGHSGAINSVSNDPSGKFILSGSSDNTIKLWDIEKRNELATLIPIDSTDWVVTSPTGLFDASPGAMNLMHFVSGMEVIEFNQLKDRYYEPGLLKKIVNQEDLRAVQGFNDVKLHPGIELSPVKDGKFNIKLKNRGGGIGRVIISINGKEIEKDARGGQISENADLLQLSKDIKNHPYLLPDKENDIEVKAYNAEGWLVSRGSIIKYKPEKEKETEIPQIFIVSIGVSDYTGNQIDLKYAAKDAFDIGKTIRTGANRLFGEEKVHTYLLSAPLPQDSVGKNFFFAKPTKESIKNTFMDIQSQAKSSDILVVYLSGHGINHGGDNGDFYYLTSDAYTASVDAYNDPTIRKNTTISSEELTELIKIVPALKQVLIIDACASGKVVDNLIAQKDIPSSTIRALDRMKDRTGMHIITGSAADAVSYEAGQYGQGVLTYTIIDGIRGSALREEKYIDISTLFQYSREKVPILAKGIGGIQEPQVFSPYGAQSFDIGILTDEDKSSILLAKVKPVFIRSMFMDTEQYSDVLSISKKVNELLNETSAKGKESELIFVDVSEYPEAFVISGGYVQSEGEITVSIKLKKGNEQELSFSIKAKNADELSQKIIEKVLETLENN